MPCYLLSTPEVLSASQEQLFATEPSLLIHSHWLSFSAFPHVVGNRCCLLLLCHVPHEAWVEVSTISRSKIFPRQSPQNAQRKTSIIESSTGLAGHRWFIEWMPPLRAARTRVFKVLLTGFLAKAFFKPLGVFTAQAPWEIAFQQAIGTTGTQDFLLSHSHTAWDVILSLFFHTPFTTQDFLLPLTILKSGSVVFPAKRRGLFESMDVFTTKALSEDSLWHLLGSKPLLSHITRTRPRLVNIALSGPMSFFSPFHTTPQMLRRRNLETSRKCYLETPQRPFQVPFARMCSVPKNVRNYWDPGFVSSGCLHFEHCWHLLGPKPLLKPMWASPLFPTLQKRCPKSLPPPQKVTRPSGNKPGKALQPHQ